MLPFSSSYGPCGRRGTLEFFDNSSSFLDELKDLVFLRLSWWIKGWNYKFPFSSSDILRESSCLIWKSQSIRPCKLNNMVSFSTWSPPPVGPLKWNVDASFDPNLSQAASGGVLISDQGIFICILSSPIPYMEINSVEVYAIFRALKIASSSERIKRHTLIIESDSINVVRWCNEDVGGPWSLSFNLNFIRNVRRSWMNVYIIHKEQSTNAVADTLAKQGLRRIDDFLAWCFYFYMFFVWELLR